MARWRDWRFSASSASVPPEALCRYALTEEGAREGGRRFADEFKDLTKPGHGECGDPDCECQQTAISRTAGTLGRGPSRPDNTMPTIAVAGKGGSGKTTIAGTLARVLARSGREVWAIDADSTPNLGITLGLSREESAAVAPIPRSILHEDKDDEGKRRLTLGVSPAQVVAQYSAATPDAVRLLLMGRVDHAGAG